MLINTLKSSFEKMHPKPLGTGIKGNLGSENP